MKFYIASKLENHEVVTLCRECLERRGHKITYDWTKHGPVYKHGLKRISEVAELEAKGVADAHVVIVLWPGGRGTHVELGIALGLGKRVILMSNVDAHHYATTETCAFYHHPLVTLCRQDNDVIDAMHMIEHELFSGHALNGGPCSACGDLDGCHKIKELK